MADASPKQQIIDKLQAVDTVMVTVSSNPSVDALSAALGLTLLINKLNKHATAVFSGDIPPAITFLDPKKTFENTVDSLRDFIIALDKEKADHLRYKVDGDMVKIFITPYRTTITDRDLEFSQGDYNVEMVIAIGVTDDSDLDHALADHGKIMHDATVAALSIGNTQSDIGSINWHEAYASSYSELLVGVAEGLRKDKSLLDEQVASAFLTGIVAATDRFSNERTTSTAMTMAADLMAAGANQQLIATKLAEAHEVSEITTPSEPRTNNDGTMALSDDVLARVDRKSDSPPNAQAPDGDMQISHEKVGSIESVTRQTEAQRQRAATTAAKTQLADQQAAKSESEAALAKQLASQQQQSDVPSVAEIQQDLAAASSEVDSAASATGITDMNLPMPMQHEPMFGGTLNATTDSAAEDARRAMENDHNKGILQHNAPKKYVGNPPNRPTATAPDVTKQNSEALHEMGATLRGHDLQPIRSSEAPAKTLADINAAHRTQGAEPHDAITAALNSGLSAEEQRNSIPAMTYEAVEPAPPRAQPPAAPPKQGDSQPQLPPMPDFSQLPPELPAADTANDAALEANFPPAPAPATPPAPPSPADPKQFQIPGQS
ncbi:hypothetical protein CR983_03120 [Candidatus Saccharibacteria bacterium]|nr:MAG: hypothetical protein CR983_03120 [Candidatus Saccharibacteria bacterium]